MPAIVQRKWIMNAAAISILCTLTALVSVELSSGQDVPQLFVISGEVLILTSGQTIKEGQGISLSMTDRLIARANSEAVMACREVRRVPVNVATDVKTLCRISEPASQKGIIPKWVWSLVETAYGGQETNKRQAATKGGEADNKVVDIIAPAQDTIVLTSTPWFAWRGPAGGYQVAVFQGSRLIWRIEVRGKLRLTYPPGYDPLPVEGKKTQYTWEITSLDGTGVASADFHVLEPATASTIRLQLNQLNKDLEAAGIRSKNKSLALAGFMQRENLQAEAVSLLENALSSAPDDPELQLALRYIKGIPQP